MVFISVALVINIFLQQIPQSTSQAALHTIKNQDGSLDYYEDRILCYEYTWKGPWNDKFNESDQSTCGSLNQKGMPCFHPFVWTYGEFKNNQPLPEVIEAQCKLGDIHGNVCDPTCMKNENTCIKMTYFVRGSDSIANATSFCGKAMDTNNGKAMTSGCYKEKNKDGFDVEVCFCDLHLCNQSSYLNCQKSAFVGVLFFIVILLIRFEYFFVNL